MNAKHNMMVREANNKVGLQAYFYDADTSEYVGEADSIKFVNKDMDRHMSTYVECEIEVMFNNETYTSKVYI